MAAFDSAVPSDAFRKSETRYWDMVGEALDRVFAQDNADLANEYHARLNAYRRSLENASTMELLLVYHAEPLDVAADLAGESITSNRVDRYRQAVTSASAPDTGSARRAPRSTARRDAKLR